MAKKPGAIQPILPDGPVDPSAITPPAPVAKTPKAPTAIQSPIPQPTVPGRAGPSYPGATSAFADYASAPPLTVPAPTPVAPVAPSAIATPLAPAAPAPRSVAMGAGRAVGQGVSMLKSAAPSVISASLGVVADPDAATNALAHPIQTAGNVVGGLQDIGRAIPSLGSNLSAIGGGLSHEDPAVRNATQVAGLHAASNGLGLNLLSRIPENAAEYFGGIQPGGPAIPGRMDGGSSEGDHATWRHGTTQQVFADALRQGRNETDPRFQFYAQPHQGAYPGDENAKQAGAIRYAAERNAARQKQFAANPGGPAPAQYVAGNFPPAAKPLDTVSKLPAPVSTSFAPPPLPTILQGLAPPIPQTPVAPASSEGDGKLRTWNEFRGGQSRQMGAYTHGDSPLLSGHFAFPAGVSNPQQFIAQRQQTATANANGAGAKADALRAQANLDTQKASVFSDPNSFMKAFMLGGGSPAEAQAGAALTNPASPSGILNRFSPGAGQAFAAINPDMNPGTAVASLMDHGLFANGVQSPSDQAGAEMLGKIYPPDIMQRELQTHPANSRIPFMSDRDVEQRLRARAALEAIYASMNGSGQAPVSGGQF